MFCFDFYPVCCDTYQGDVAGDPAQLVALLVYQHLAVDALEALAAQAPDAVPAEGTEGLPVEPLGLEDVPVHLVHLAPPAGAAPVDAAVLAVAEVAGRGRHAGEHVHRELRILVHLQRMYYLSLQNHFLFSTRSAHLIQPDGLI